MSKQRHSNFVNQYTKQSYDGSTSATKVRAANRKLIYSRYKLSKVFQHENERFTSCAFLPDDQHLLIGSGQGEVQIVNTYNDDIIALANVHEEHVTSLVPHKSGELLLTTGGNISCDLESALWNIKYNFENQFVLKDCYYAECTHAYDKVLGTIKATAKLYDLNSGQTIHEYKPAKSNLYYNNKAALNHSDDLLLTDGVMFDVHTGKEVHKFERSNLFFNGVFHSNRLEVISSSKVWDLRTFRLIQTVENLETRKIKFNNYGDVIFSLPRFNPSLILDVVDATDYSSIDKICVNDYARSLEINTTDTQIAMVVNSGISLYDIGMA